MSTTDTQNMTADQIYALHLAHGDEASQAKCRRQIDHATGRRCIACGATSGIEDNGCTGADLAFLCPGCGHQWDAADVEVDLPPLDEVDDDLEEAAEEQALALAGNPNWRPWS
jgi:hypothetical protein